MLAMSTTHRSLTTLLLVVFTVCSAQAPDDNSGFEPIFDGKTLTKQYRLVEPERTIEVQPTKEEFMEVKLPDLVVTVQGEPKMSSDAPSKSEEEKTLKADPNQPPQ